MTPGSAQPWYHRLEVRPAPKTLPAKPPLMLSTAQWPYRDFCQNDPYCTQVQPLRAERPIRRPPETRPASVGQCKLFKVPLDWVVVAQNTNLRQQSMLARWNIVRRGFTIVWPNDRALDFSNGWKGSPRRRGLRSCAICARDRRYEGAQDRLTDGSLHASIIALPN
jgi:hypothetical protein